MKSDEQRLQEEEQWNIKRVVESNEEFWRELNKTCLSCTKECKQSSKIKLVLCPIYENIVLPKLNF